ncbi:hypothetical protein VL20_396 [Microcystis panniformis FACHB-1757]|uniref:Uncharacterized protein n=1 Tax=Microcystis panniformis FACHB-1757 TaxID=1638788 RepID=A0A0K1RV07_9CHRO|nr:hypothetical protein VL20_396 [Microcystis panniformis FACHB-1757]
MASENRGKIFLSWTRCQHQAYQLLFRLEKDLLTTGLMR